MKTKLLIVSLFILSSQVYAEAVQKNGTNKTIKKSSVATGANAAFSTAEMSWVDEKIEEIKPQRNGMSGSRLASLKSPFIIIKKEVKETKGGKTTTKSSNTTVSPKDDKKSPLKKDMSKEPLTLQIVLNSSALINGIWLKENDKTRGYTLTQIQSSYVVLEKKKKKVKLFIAHKSDNLNISTK